MNEEREPDNTEEELREWQRRMPELKALVAQVEKEARCQFKEAGKSKKPHGCAPNGD